MSKGWHNVPVKIAILEIEINSLDRPVDQPDKMLKSKPSMEPIASAVEKVVAGTLRRAAGPQTPLLAWPLACGSVVAERTRALEFRQGVLRVEVPDTAWRAELQHLAPKYLAVMGRYAAGVNRIEFVLKSQK